MILNFSLFCESSSEYYYEISHHEWFGLYEYLLKFYQSDYEHLERLIDPNFRIYKLVKNGQWQPGHPHSKLLFMSDHGFTSLSPMIKIIGNTLSYEIVKLKDEWFLVSEYDSSYDGYSNKECAYYKCDQLHGVEKLLTDKDVCRSTNINESKSEELFIFDFDDTLVLNNSFEELAIEYLKEDVTIRTLLNTSVNKIGVKISDLKWENGKIYVSDADSKIDIKDNWVRKGKRVYLLPPDRFYYLDMSFPVDTTGLKELYNRVSNKAIVTGRVSAVKGKVEKALDKFGLESPNYGLHCYPTRQQTSDKVAVWKAKTIVDLIKKSGLKTVHFYDDNSKWVNKATALVKKELPDINWNPVKFKTKK